MDIAINIDHQDPVVINKRQNILIHLQLNILYSI